MGGPCFIYAQAMKFLIPLLICASFSCQSPKSKALGSIDRISVEASEGSTKAESLRTYLPEEAYKVLDAVIAHFATIVKEANTNAAPSVRKLKNPASWWEQALQWVKWGLIAIIGLWLTLALGQLRFPLLRTIVSWLARKGFPFLTGASSDAVWVAEEMYERGQNTQEYRKMVNKMRATNPSFDGAFVRAKAEAKRKIAERQYSK